MLNTLADARAECSRFVENGSCDTTLVNKRINQALERLLDEYPGTYEEYRIMRMSVCNKCFALPYNVEGILSADINGVPAKIYSPAYQFLSAGVGDLDFRTAVSGCFKDLVDQGDHFPIMYDIPHTYETTDGTEYTPNGLKLAIFSTATQDVNAQVTIKGFNYLAETVYTDGVEGITLETQLWKGGVEGSLRGTWDDGITLSSQAFSDITRVVKPVTRGYLCLYAADPATNSMFLLAKYHPSQTTAQFRRYIMTNQQVGSFSSILMRVKLRLIPLVADDDILPIESLQAVKLAVMAIESENAKDLAGYSNLMSSAIRAMSKREGSKVEKGTATVINFDKRFSLGRRMNRPYAM